MNKEIIALFSFFIFWILFFPTNQLISNQTYDGWGKNCMIIFMLVYNRKNIWGMFEGDYKKFNIALVVYCAVCILSVFLNLDSIGRYTTYKLTEDGLIPIRGYSTIKPVVYYGLSLLSMTIFFQRLTDEGQIYVFLNCFFKIFILFVFWVDYDALNHVVVDDDIFGYVVENKFYVCYNNMFCVVLYYLLHPFLNKIYEKYILLFLLLLTLFVSLHVQCSTMVLGSFVLFCLIFLYPKKYRDKLSNPKGIVCLIVILDLFFFLFLSFLIQIPFIQKIIIEVLHEDLTLTGRLFIYQTTLKAFDNNLLFGYGYGNSDAVVRFFVGGVTNAQNGIVELFLNIGFLGVMAFLSVIYQALMLGGWRSDKYPIIAFIYTIIVISTIEVPFSVFFLFFIMLLLSHHSVIPYFCTENKKNYEI